MTEDRTRWTIERIVRRLSKSQREALLWLPRDGSPRTRSKGAPSQTSFYCLSNILIGKPAQEVAVTYKLAVVSSPKIVDGKWAETEARLTPLGMKVAAWVEANHG